MMGSFLIFDGESRECYYGGSCKIVCHPRMILSPIQAFGDGYGFYLNKTRFPLKSVAGMTILEFCKRLYGIGFGMVFNFFSPPPILSIVNNIKDDVIGHRQRLKERYLKNGAAGLHIYEVLELLLTYALPRRYRESSLKRAKEQCLGFS